MPNEDVSITDIILIDVITVESPHYPYDNNSDKVYYENTFSGAKSITIDLTYGTESDQYDYVAITDADGNTKKYGNMGLLGDSEETKTITIDGDYIKIAFKSDDSGNEYYGFKAIITPNYE